MAVFDNAAIREIIGDVLRLPDNGPATLNVQPAKGPRGQGHFDAESPAGTVRGRLMPRAPIAQIDSSYVSPEFRGQGKGMELYQLVLNMAKEKGLYLTSDRTVSDDAAKVYQGLANRGEQVYSGANNRLDYSDDPDYIPDPTGNNASNVYNQNSAGGPVFAVVPQGNPGNLRDLLSGYMGVGNSPENQRLLDYIVSTYSELKANNGTAVPQSVEEIDNDPDFEQTIAIVLGILGSAGAGAASQNPMTQDIMETIG